ncbi:MAG: DsrE family protein [Pseudomonadota bacterium]
MRTSFFAATLSLVAQVAVAQGAPEGFTTGPLLEGQGPNAEVPGMTPLPKRARLKVAFDVGKGAKEGEANRTLVSAARFMNMHVRAGMAPERLAAAVVVHGKAVGDVSGAAAGTPNGPLIEALVANNVRVIVCGQSAAAQGVSAEDLLPGVEMSLSAMTAHALLQQDGYTVNPF